MTNEILCNAEVFTANVKRKFTFSIINHLLEMTDTKLINELTKTPIPFLSFPRTDGMASEWPCMDKCKMNSFSAYEGYKFLIFNEKTA